MGLNPSKRYTPKIAEKEASDLAQDIEKALERKLARNEINDEDFHTLTAFLEESAKLTLALRGCRECKISYSKGKIEGFCENHQKESEEFQKMIDKALKD